MAIVGAMIMARMPIQPGTWNALSRVAWPMAACVATYAAVIALIGRAEWSDAFKRA
jgi:hypothetical protein